MSTRDEGMLAGCLVHGDPAVQRQARRRRQKALLISVALEGLALAAMLLWPALAPGVLARRFIVTPAPPFSGRTSAKAKAPRNDAAVPPRNHTAILVPVFQPPRVPAHIAILDPGAPIVAPVLPGDAIYGNVPGAPSGLGSGDVLPGGIGGTPPPLVRPALPPPAPVRRSEGVQQALLIHRVDPVYPRLAAQIHLEGTVVLRAVIGADGGVTSLAVLSGHPILAQAALDAVRQWRYRPTLLNNMPAEVDTTITVIFRLQ